MKKIVAIIISVVSLVDGFRQSTITLTKAQLKDKIMGGWAGQTIGVTFGDG